MGRIGFLISLAAAAVLRQEHITAIKHNAVAGLPPRKLPATDCLPSLRPEPLTIGDDSLFVNVGERTNVTGSAKFKTPDQRRSTAKRLTFSPAGKESGAQIIDQHG